MNTIDGTVYENWKVYSMHNKLIFRCGQKKTQWYLDRHLAIPHPEQKRAIQLTFEAAGDGHAKDKYMIEDRDNACVACSSQASLTKHHVVPEVYRRAMPVSIKSKSVNAIKKNWSSTTDLLLLLTGLQSRDILILCKYCHDKYERHAVDMKKKLAEKYSCPLEGKGWVQMPEHRSVKKAAQALRMPPDALAKIPKDRTDQLTQIVETFRDNTPSIKGCPWSQVLAHCADLRDRVRGPDFVDHGTFVINQLARDDSKTPNDSKDGSQSPPLILDDALKRFIKMWRQHFLDHAQPKHLSHHWSVEAPIP
ncbi:hypothetical protein DM01DRAFT_1318003 [Hesseltinella vesiculosa]|uniref:Uncharacterized protein n=1 Tax=Hesseltinella vesiculosa TaxID=101127 RepID=A0A1X2GT50_9FUNG|nr:hypothetical protein DM01DRAFT_1318003 [Hesseltinella vesiculosa]